MKSWLVFYIQITHRNFPCYAAVLHVVPDSTNEEKTHPGLCDRIAQHRAARAGLRPFSIQRSASRVVFAVSPVSSSIA